MSARSVAQDLADHAVGEPIESFETQGERRRLQMVAIAAKLVIAGGVEAVSHSSIAEHAGVVRTAVYRYFPARDDLLAAVLSAYSALQTRSITSDDVIAGVLALAHATPAQMPQSIRLLEERLWDPEVWTAARLELRLAAVILQRDLGFVARLQAQRREIAAEEGTPLSEPLTQIGLTSIEIGIVTDAFLAARYHTTAAVLAGTIDQTDAIRLSYRMNLAAVHAFLD